MSAFEDHNCDGQRQHTGVQSPFLEREEDQSLWLAPDFILPEEKVETQGSSLEAVTRSSTRNQAHWTNALTIMTCMMSLFLWIGKLSPRFWGRLLVCQRRMEFMCVGLLLSLTERFVYGSSAFFFFFFFFTWDVCCTHFTYVNKFLFVVQVWLITLGLVVSFALPVCEMCCPFCTCIYILGAHAIFIFKTFDFFGRNTLNGQILQCPHDDGRLLLSEQCSTCTSLLIQLCKRRCSTSSRLMISFSFCCLQKLRRPWTRSRVVCAAP